VIFEIPLTVHCLRQYLHWLLNDFSKEKNRMKSRFAFGLTVLALIAVFATSSFAQIQITVTNSAPSPSEIRTNRNAATSDTSAVGNGILVSGSLLAQSQLTASFLTLSFPAPITSSTTIPTGDPIRVTGGTGVFATASISTVNYATGVVTLNLPSAASNVDSGSFRVVGVRIDANGKTAPLTGTVAINSGANNYLLNTSTFNVISALNPGIASGAVGSISPQVSQGSALMFTNQTTNSFSDATASFTITEGFASAWKTALQASTSGVALLNGTQIKLTVNGLPAGVGATITPTLPGTSTATLTAGAQAVTVAANSASWDFATTDTTTVETLQFNLTLTGAPTGTLTPGAITVAASMGPTGNALTAAGVPAESGTNTVGYPRFAAENTTITVGSIAVANTTMLIPYFAKGFGLYDFCIGISNTNSSPFGAANGGATPTDGAITFTVYVRGTAAPIVLSTATLTPAQASGIVAGKIPAGGVFTAALSQMLPASAGADVVGYIFVQADFLNAHGIAYLFESNRITSAAPVLVLSPPSSTARTGPVESLSF
jgi:hypothetical protein